MEYKDFLAGKKRQVEWSLPLSETISLISACVLVLPMQILILSVSRSLFDLLKHNATNPTAIVCNILAATQILLWWLVRCRLIYSRPLAVILWIASVAAVLFLHQHRYADALLVYGAWGWSILSASNAILIMRGIARATSK